jgi:hypothetical protein
MFSVLIGTGAQSTLIELVLGALGQGVRMTIHQHLSKQREFASRMKNIRGRNLRIIIGVFVGFSRIFLLGI